jgi:ATP-dependent DNA ligase
MLYAFSLPTKSDKVPTGSDWIHEIKYDGYRMLVVRERDRVRLISRGGRDWADPFSLIVAGALKLPEGEVVVLRQDGTSDFDALTSRKHDKRAMRRRRLLARVAPPPMASRVLKHSRVFVLQADGESFCSLSVPTPQ